MARPRTASDEQIIATAEELAAEKGWKAVYGKEVREKLARGGSLSTFTQVINAWRAEKCVATLLVNMRDIEPRKEDDGFDGAFLSP